MVIVITFVLCHKCAYEGVFLSLSDMRKAKDWPLQ